MIFINLLHNLTLVDKGNRIYIFLNENVTNFFKIALTIIKNLRILKSVPW